MLYFVKKCFLVAKKNIHRVNTIGKAVADKKDMNIKQIDTQNSFGARRSGALNKYFLDALCSIRRHRQNKHALKEFKDLASKISEIYTNKDLLMQNKNGQYEVILGKESITEIDPRGNAIENLSKILRSLREKLRKEKSENPLAYERQKQIDFMAENKPFKKRLAEKRADIEYDVLI